MVEIGLYILWPPDIEYEKLQTFGWYYMENIG